MKDQAIKVPEIITARLTLNSLQPSDASALFEYRSDPEVARYQDWQPSSLDEVVSFIEDSRSIEFDTPGTWFQLGARQRETSQLIGDLGVHFPVDEPRQVEIGFTIAPGSQRRGFGAEAVTGLLSYLFSSLRKHRVFASVDPRNLASIALLERMGMRQEAHFRESVWFKGSWVDDVVFAVLASEWSSRDD